MPALVVTDLHKSFRLKRNKLPILRALNLTVEEGEFVVLCGSSGCGKTTLLHLLGAMDRPDRGEIQCLGRNLTSLGMLGRARLRAHHLSFVFQSFQLLNEFTALENVALAGRVAGRSARVSRDRAAELLGSVGLGDRIDHLPTELSGGEQQRVAIARSLMNDPELILADEPTGNLDDASSEQVLSSLHALQKEGKTIVMVTHDRRLGKAADRVLELQDGTLTGG